MLKALAPSRLANMLSPRSAAAARDEAPPLVIAGVNIAAWELVEISDVPPGPLGIHLDARHADAAVLDHYPALTNNAAMGPIERDGRVVAGSVLASVNEYDFLEQRLTLQEIGRVLRDTAHLARTVRFRVPPSKAASDPAEDSAAVSPTKTEMIEKRVLLSGTISSSTKALDVTSPSKKTWTFKGLLSPSAATGASSPATAVTTDSAPVAPAEQADKTPREPAASSSPTAAALRSPSRTSVSDRRVVAKVPPGPLGLNLDGGIKHKAVVLGFLPLPDGSQGVLEQRGDIASGSTLVAINGMSVAHMSLDETRTRLGALAGLERELVFELPDPRAHETNQVSNEAMDERRKAELPLILRFDKRKLTRKECWFLVSTEWMERWVAFTTHGGPLPGPISNDTLLEPDWRERLSGAAVGRPDATRPELELMKHYRGVSPMVWSLFVELHGDDNIPILARYALDAAAEPVSETEINSFLREPRLRAMTLVKELRDRFPTAFP
ncbi:hypothetical protein ATCC90586_001649 [Pythium insidiosum]|nr:hypothetical protein ATCC90586_001649 [Pythium insidiosum]